MEPKTVAVERVRTKGILGKFSWMTDPFAVTHASSMQMYNLKRSLLLRYDGDGQDLRMGR